ncbi:helix-turn-helix transcriptional regulator [Shewanella sp. 10N.286.45.A1]|uniref:helix-turn-helix transcriptional regulator n=1 Tax=Shewanella sp. 10N.286.45.A1 TaxID=3229694 RepID=UPI00354E733E
MMEIIQNRSDRFLRLRDVMEVTTLCRSSIYLLISAGDFPSNYAIMGKRKAWLESEVQAWLQTKITPYN